MAQKQKRNELANPEGAKNLDGVVAEGVVKREPKLSFEERTKGNPAPYMDEDGNQNNGSEFNADNVEEVEPQIVTPEEPEVEEEEVKTKKKGKK
jgi:hypothetical protein